jgi:putative flavoprotein involved in K+ transport
MSDSTQQVSAWLSKFDAALERADFDVAAGMFGEESYWRDLVSLTWNIKTVAGKEDVKRMLEATIREAKPKQWKVEGNASSDNGVLSGWLTFETAVARGKGHIRLKDGKC